MEVDAHIVTINGTDYMTRQEAERLLTEEADERRRVHMQAEIDQLRSTIRELEEVRRMHSRHSD